MDKKIIDYQIICAATDTSFNKNISSQLETGWELYGFPFFRQMEQGGQLCQAMIKYQNEEKKSKSSVLSR